MNIIEALEANRIEYKKGSGEDEYRICCPFCAEEGHSQDTRFRFGFNTATGQGHCFNCGMSFSSTALHAVIKKLELGEIVEVQKRVKEIRRAENKLETVRLPPEFQRLPENNWTFWGKVAWRYARDRGLTPKQMVDKGIGYAEAGEFAYRLIIPVTYKRRLYGFVGRDFSGRTSLKYKNSTGGKAVFNIPERPSSTAVLAEGAFDALAIERALRVNALAVLGASLSEPQLKMLRGYDRFVLWPDSDKDGVRHFMRMATQLQQITTDIWMIEPEYGEGDPDELGSAKIDRKYKNAKRFTPSSELELKAWAAFEEE